VKSFYSCVHEISWFSLFQKDNFSGIKHSWISNYIQLLITFNVTPWTMKCEDKQTL